MTGKRGYSAKRSWVASFAGRVLSTRDRQLAFLVGPLPFVLKQKAELFVHTLSPS